ncbi:MAG: RagB/SusD family nutrient uptake outer membrane protein [Chitinophagaceae bacterium]|nr:RagB/SusD family nutrient uptake outer membrane protein [Chitinophagaceae bacterium]
MKQISYKIIGLAILISSITASCNKKLDRLPSNAITADQVYSTPLGYKQAFVKLYAAFGLTGNQGPAGGGDIQGIDEGFSDFLRLYFKAQELSTDEAVIAWGDVGIQDFHNMNWSSANPFLQGLYYRCYYQITLCNEFIRQSTDDKISSRSITGTDASNIKKYRTEARFLRAYQYSIIMDLFGSGPFVTDADVLASIPKQGTRADIFKYVESELKAIEPDLAAAKTADYGRADRAAEWALLARIYLNAKIYTGTDHYADAVAYSKKVIDAGYSLISDYRWLMLADNQQNTSEFILTINYDGLKSQSYGGTTFLTHAPNGGSMPGSVTGVAGGWGGLRTTKNLVNLFPDLTGTIDKRAQFYTPGQKLEINSETVFTDGIAVTKYRNKTRDGGNGSSQDFSDIDFPIFRLAEMYLIYAEATLRGGGGDNTTALNYVNLLRTRAYGSTSGNVASINLDFLLDERARELYWEGFRRTDLIRYGKFTTSTYLWPWKGGVKDGRSVEDFRNIYPIPSSDVAANSNLTQNPGY